MITHIWITYYDAGGLHAGGLERCQVWFQEPRYFVLITERTWEDIDHPFGDQNGQREGVQHDWGWRAIDPGRESISLSFGKTFGYESGLSKYVWKMLCQHFGSNNLREWVDIEKSGKALSKNFCLNVPLNISNFE